MVPLEDRRFLFITGKGGVGKTTVTAALARKLAGNGKRVLIAACDAKERISLMFAKPGLTSEVQQLTDGVYGIKITPEAALRQYGSMVLRSQTLYSAVFDNKYVRNFFAGVPGLYEWAMLGKAWFHTTDEAEESGERFDVVLFDAPATGHGLDMLRVPKIIVELVPPGLLRKDAERAWTMFQDPKQSGVVVVTLPEDMPTNETIELFGALQGELKLPVARLIINGVMQPLFSDQQRDELLSYRKLRRDEPGDEAIASGVRRAIRERVQEQSLKALRALNAERVELPLLTEDATQPEAIGRLSALLE